MQASVILSDVLVAALVVWAVLGLAVVLEGRTRR